MPCFRVTLSSVSVWMALLLPGAAAAARHQLWPCCPHHHHHRSRPYNQQSSSSAAKAPLIGHVHGNAGPLDGCGGGLGLLRLPEDSSTRVFCSSAEELVNGTEAPIGHIGGVGEDEQASGNSRSNDLSQEDSTTEQSMDHEASAQGNDEENSLLDLVRDKPKSLSAGLKRYLFVSPDRNSRPSKWAERRMAVLAVQNASNIESALKRVGHKLEVSDLNLLMRRFSNLGRSDDACQLFDWMERKKKVSAASYSSYLILLGMVGRPNRALNVYKSLSDEFRLNSFVCNSILSTLVNNWKVKKAFKLFQKMKEEGFEPNPISYSRVLCACLKIHNGYEKSQELLEDMKSRGMKPDPYAYGSLLRVYCANGLEDRAISLIEEMKSQGVTLTLFHYSYLLNLYGRINKPLEAEKVVASIKEAGLVPNEVIYRSLLNVYGRNGLLEQAKATFNEMQASGMHPDMVMYSALMDAYVRTGHVYEAHDVLLDMRRDGIRPGGNAYSILISAYGSLGDIDMIDKLAVESQDRRKGKQDVRLFNALLKAYSQLKHDDGITNTLERIDTEGIMPDKGSFNILIHHLCMKRMFGLALRTFKDMKRRGLKPNLGTYTRLIEGLTKPVEPNPEQSDLYQILTAAENAKERDAGLLAEAYRIFKEMEASKVYCSQSALEQFIQANSVARNWPVVMEALEVLKKSDYTGSQELLESVLVKAAEDSHFGTMNEILKEVKEQGYSLSSETVLKAKERFNQLDQVKDVLESLEL